MAKSHLNSPTNNALIKALIIVAMFMALPGSAFAQSFDLPIITNIGCKIIAWMQGPLAIVIFLLVAVVTIVIGMFAKMDWSKIMSIVVLYGILQGLGTVLITSGFVNMPAGCLR